MTGSMDPGVHEAVTAMADVPDTPGDRRDVYLGYIHSGHHDLAAHALWAWITLVTAEHVVLALWDTMRHGTHTWRDGEEL